MEFNLISEHLNHFDSMFQRPEFPALTFTALHLVQRWESDLLQLTVHWQYRLTSKSLLSTDDLGSIQRNRKAEKTHCSPLHLLCPGFL